MSANRTATSGVVMAGTARQTNILFDNAYGRLRSVVFGADGALYFTTSNGAADRILRITPTQP